MTSDFFARQWTGYLNETRRSLGLLVGIIQGILGDGELTEGEIRFLDAWLRDNDAISTSWPGDILHQKIRAVLEDGVITSAERLHLIETLQDLVGAPKADLAARSHVTELAYDDVPQIRFPGSTFCLTGDFLYGSRDSRDYKTGWSVRRPHHYATRLSGTRQPRQSGMETWELWN